MSTRKIFVAGLVFLLCWGQLPAQQGGGWCGTESPRADTLSLPPLPQYPTIPPPGVARGAEIRLPKPSDAALSALLSALFRLAGDAVRNVFANDFFLPFKDPQDVPVTLKVRVIFTQDVKQDEKAATIREAIPLVEKYFYTAHIYLDIDHMNLTLNYGGTGDDARRNYWNRRLEPGKRPGTYALWDENQGLRKQAEERGVWRNGAINVFLMDTGGDDLAKGLAQRPGSVCWARSQSKAKDTANLVAHEVGHCLSLLHTFEEITDRGTFNFLGKTLTKDNYSGDRVGDTPEERANCCSGEDLGSGCHVSESKYNSFSENCKKLSRNLMSYYDIDHRDQEFTTGQSKRMRRFLEIWGDRNKLSWRGIKISLGAYTRRLVNKISISDWPVRSDPAISSSNVSVSLKSGSVAPGSATFNASFPSGSVLHYILFTGRYRGPSSVWTVDHFVNKTAAAYGRSPGTNVPIRNKAFGSGDIKLEGLSPNTEYTLYYVADVASGKTSADRKGVSKSSLYPHRTQSFTTKDLKPTFSSGKSTTNSRSYRMEVYSGVTVRYTVHAGAAQSLDGASVRTGTGGIKRGSLTSSGAIDLKDLSPCTQYTIYAVASMTDGSHHSAVVTDTFWTKRDAYNVPGLDMHTPTHNSVSGIMRYDEVGKIYYVLLNREFPSITSANIVSAAKEGTMDGKVAGTVSSSGQRITLSGLSSCTKYYLYAVAGNEACGYSNVVKKPPFTTRPAPPKLVQLENGLTHSSQSYRVNFGSSESSLELRYRVLKGARRSGVQLRNYHDVLSRDLPLHLMGLQSGEEYTVYARSEGSCGNSDMVSSKPFTTGSVDSDGDGLIDVYHLAHLNHMRHNLSGTGYRSTALGEDEALGTHPGSQSGCGSMLTGSKRGKCHGYELMNDLDFRDSDAAGYDSDWDSALQKAKSTPGAGWSPVGDASGRTGSAGNYVYPNAFSGVFEGNGKTINNLYINIKSSPGSTPVYSGLFGLASGDIRNVDMSGSFVSSSVSSSYSGGLVGYASGNITSCHARNATIEGLGSVDGLVGYASLGITNCGFFSVTVEGLGSVGGLVGEAGTGTEIISSSSSGSVSATSGNVGGLAGAAGSIIDSRSSSAVSFSLSGVTSVGGLVGSASGRIMRSRSTGVLSEIKPPSDSAVGGFRYIYIGGLAGSASGVESCRQSGGSLSILGDGLTFSGMNLLVGGLVGRADSLKYCHVRLRSVQVGNSDLSSSLYVGGLVGFVCSGKILDSSSIVEGLVEGKINVGVVHVGGLVGSTSTGGEITNSYAKVGGGPRSFGNLSSVARSGKVTINLGNLGVRGTGRYSYSYVTAGGLVGYGNNTSISHSYASTPVVEGDGLYSYVGGLVGHAGRGWCPFYSEEPKRSLSEVLNCYAHCLYVLSRSTKRSSAGGLVGYSVKKLSASLDISDSPEGSSNTSYCLTTPYDTLIGEVETNVARIPTRGVTIVGSYSTGDVFVEKMGGLQVFAGPLLGGGASSSSGGNFHSGKVFCCVEGNCSFNVACDPECASRRSEGWSSCTSTYDRNVSTLKSLDSLKTLSQGLPDAAWSFGTDKQFPTLKDTRGKVLCDQPRGYVPCAGDGDSIPDDEDVDDDNDGLIEIWSLRDLDNIRNDLDGSHYNDGTGSSSVGCPSSGCKGYELMANLDFTDKTAVGYSADWDPVVQKAKGTPGAGWPPIGDYSLVSSGGSTTDLSNRRVFTGTFEGNEHTISNLYINLKSSANDTHIYAGLFGHATGTLKVVGLTGEHMSVKATATHRGSGSYAGGLVGVASGSSTLTNCYATGAVSSSSRYYSSFAGGLVGVASGDITNCYATGAVSSSSSSSVSSAGGLVGYVYVGGIRNCYATGAVSSSSSSSSVSSAGGLVGYVYVGGIRNCYATGAVSSSSRFSYSFAGGLVGYVRFSSTLTNCYATGDVTSVSSNLIYAGGVTGKAEGGSKVLACYYSGVVKKGTSSTIGTATPIQASGQYKSETALKAPIDARKGIYASWSTKDWAFGTSSQYPTLRYYKTNSSGTQVQGDIMCGQPGQPTTRVPCSGGSSTSGSDASRSEFSQGRSGSEWMEVIAAPSDLDPQEAEAYPNPTSGLLTIPETGEADRVRVYSVAGSVVTVLSVSPGGQVDLGQLPSGTYVLRMSSGRVFRVVKQ